MVDTHNGHPCPNCGCRDSRPAGASSRWGYAQQRRQCRYCHLQFTPAGGPPAVDDDAAEVGGRDAEEDRQAALVAAHSNGYKAVIFHPLRCPECQSKKVHVASKRRRGEQENPQVRAMKCQDCGAAFKSVEA